jgi:hypothetical protein
VIAFTTRLLADEAHGPGGMKKLITFSSVILFAAQVADGQVNGAQRSNDAWDAQFHPQEFAKRVDEQWQDWLKKLGDKLLGPQEVLDFWKLGLYEPSQAKITEDWQQVLWASQKVAATVFPDPQANQGPGRFDASLNARINSEFATVQEKANYYAMDVADEINILRLTKLGRVAEASALAKERVERNQKRDEEAARKAILTGQAELRLEIEDLRRELREAAFSKGQR